MRFFFFNYVLNKKFKKYWMTKSYNYKSSSLSLSLLVRRPNLVQQYKNILCLLQYYTTLIREVKLLQDRVKVVRRRISSWNCLHSALRSRVSRDYIMTSSCLRSRFESFRVCLFWIGILKNINKHWTGHFFCLVIFMKAERIKLNWLFFTGSFLDVLTLYASIFS